MSSMIANQEYLQEILDQNELNQSQISSLRSVREEVESVINQLNGSPRFYYGGSYGKKTIVGSRFDLDIVVYWPNNCGYTLQQISEAVGDKLKGKWKFVNRKTVAWELPFEGGFHVDVVPGRAIDSGFYEANLYRSDNGNSLKTSIKKHIDTVRGSNRRDVIRLMKIWKAKNNLQIKSFPLELITIEGARGTSFSELEPQLTGALIYLRDSITSIHIKDPANTNNVLTEDLRSQDRLLIYHAAKAAIDARLWSSVF